MGSWHPVEQWSTFSTFIAEKREKEETYPVCSHNWRYLPHCSTETELFFSRVRALVLMATFHDLTTAQLKQAVKIREQIESLQKKLEALLGGTAPTDKIKRRAGRPAGKRTVSDEARAKIAAAQKARWAKTKTVPAKAPIKMVAKKKSGMTPAGKAKIAAAMKAR